jgi:UDP-glucose 4-epimerase
MDEIKPLSPYAESKRQSELLIKEYSNIHGISGVSLRLFNVAGADIINGIGECHEPESHLIPLAIRRSTKNHDFKIYGKSYPTPDGSCVRDYVHVLDVVQAIRRSIDLLNNRPGGYYDVFNVGSGRGTSVCEVIGIIDSFITSEKPVVTCPPREGDAASLVADLTKSAKELNYWPSHDINKIISDAIIWETRSL